MHSDRPNSPPRNSTKPERHNDSVSKVNIDLPFDFEPNLIRSPSLLLKLGYRKEQQTYKSPRLISFNEGVLT
jgi:hypothetical protein